jgi:hypothetical protein
VRAISQEISEFEFHISPAASSSRPQTGGCPGHQLEQPSRAVEIVAEAMRTLDRLADVRDHAVAPASDLVTEEAEPARRVRPDGTLGDDATLGPVAGAERCLLDHEASLRDANLERGVEEVAGGPPGEPRCRRLEEASVQTHRMAARAEREAVEVDAGAQLAGHAAIRFSGRTYVKMIWPPAAFS